MARSRPAIPEPTKRAVRQRCGFGCVLCGVPIYHYDHIKPFQEVEEHAEENLTLLCPTHHQEKTSGLLDAETVRKANAEPFNRRSGVTSTAPHRLSATWVEPRFLLAGNTFFWPGPFSAIQICGTTLLGFRREDGGLLLQVRLYDSTDKEILKVDDGELIVSTEPWDIDWQGGTFVVRSALRRISLEVDFSPPNLVSIPRGRVVHRGKTVEFSPNGLSLGATSSAVTFSGSTFRCPIGIKVDDTGIIVGAADRSSPDGQGGAAPHDPDFGSPRTRPLRRRQQRGRD